MMGWMREFVVNVLLSVIVIVFLYSIVGVLGPLARSARDLALFCKVMLDAQPWLLEAPLLEMPWKDDVANGLGLPPKLSFAIVWDDGVVAPHPPLQKALCRVKRALIDAGHEVIDWIPRNHQEGWDLIVRHCRTIVVGAGADQSIGYWTDTTLSARCRERIFRHISSSRGACSSAERVDSISRQR